MSAPLSDAERNLIEKAKSQLATLAGAMPPQPGTALVVISPRQCAPAPAVDAIDVAVRRQSMRRRRIALAALYVAVLAAGALILPRLAGPASGTRADDGAIPLLVFAGFVAFGGLLGSVSVEVRAFVEAWFDARYGRKDDGR